MPSRFGNPEWITTLLLLGLWVGFLGAFKPVVFNEGSPMAKYIAKQSQLGMVAEQDVEDYFEAVLYGEGEVREALIESVPEPERREFVERIFLLDRWVVGLLAFGSLLLLSPKLRRETAARHILPVLSLWLITQSIGVMLNGGEPFTNLAVFAHATRWALPLALWVMIFKRGKTNEGIGKGSALTHFIVVCTSVTFAIHGWEALQLNPFFQDLIYGFGSRLGYQTPPDVNAVLLRMIGCMDLILAVLILFYRSPKVFLWMACWGLITALSRPMAMGLGAWPEVAMRAANFLLPFILFTIYRTPEQPVARKSNHPTEPSHEKA